jgi:hypothetical protein
MTLHDRLTSFVRVTLGCGCPDEVFSEIVVRLAAADNPAPVRLAIEVGGRLLVHVIEEGSALREPGLIPSVLEDGVRRRDERGFNRFRLVVALEGDGAAGEILQRRFDAASARDDRTHLHVLPSSTIPW